MLFWWLAMPMLMVLPNSVIFNKCCKMLARHWPIPTATLMPRQKPGRRWANTNTCGIQCCTTSPLPLPATCLFITNANGTRHGPWVLPMFGTTVPNRVSRLVPKSNWHTYSEKPLLPTRWSFSRRATTNGVWKRIGNHRPVLILAPNRSATLGYTLYNTSKRPCKPYPPYCRAVIESITASNSPASFGGTATATCFMANGSIITPTIYSRSLETCGNNFNARTCPLSWPKRGRPARISLDMRLKRNCDKNKKMPVNEKTNSRKNTIPTNIPPHRCPNSPSASPRRTWWVTRGVTHIWTRTFTTLASAPLCSIFPTPWPGPSWTCTLYSANKSNKRVWEKNAPIIKPTWHKRKKDSQCICC
mmetsp:Transcript_9817/g.27245  ORF Transcript_9817/g.27245 Transcript_9817/m.27245 type:complete len:360 (-) Transcript_9817:780-1859(-)